MIINNRRALYVAYTFIEIIAVNQYTKKRGERATSGGLMDTLKEGEEQKGKEGEKSRHQARFGGTILKEGEKKIR